MKVLAIGPQRFISNYTFTGDAVQMRKTVERMRNIADCDVTCAYYSNATSPLQTAEGDTIPWEEIGRRFDVAHFFAIPPSSFRSLKTELAQLPTLVSTVYWGNWLRAYVSFKNEHRLIHLYIWVHYIFNRVFFKKRLLFPWCTCILPNSWAEGNAFRQEYKLSAHCLNRPVPNALEWKHDLSSLTRPSYLPKGDYIVCPGVFAPRKNQLSLIRALKGSNIPVVFVGKAPAGKEYLIERCKREADGNFHFVGFKSSEESEYWAILKYARCAVLPSDCETPGIAMLEAAAAGVRPILPIHGGTQEYYGLLAQYLNPLSSESIAVAVKEAWAQGRLTEEEAASFRRFTWQWTAELTYKAYQDSITAWRHARHS